MVQKVVYNSCFGGFSVDEEVILWVRDNVEELRQEYDNNAVDELASCTVSGEHFKDGSGPKTSKNVRAYRISRDNELLADIVEGNTDYHGNADGTHAALRIAEVPDGIEWEIDEYDGQETVREATRTFR